MRLYKIGVREANFIYADPLGKLSRPGTEKAPGLGFLSCRRLFPFFGIAKMEEILYHISVGNFANCFRRSEERVRV